MWVRWIRSFFIPGKATLSTCKDATALDEVDSNQITFIGLVSSENYYRRSRIITLIA